MAGFDEVLSGIAGLNEKIGKLDGRIENVEKNFSIFLKDHNDVIRLKTQWKFLASISAFSGAAFITLLIHYLRNNA